MIALSRAAEKLRRRKDLFIPLMTEYYDAFERGDKTSELRVYGARWNERTCDPGRMVTLSKGYGKKHRLRGVITSIDIVRALDLPVRQRNSVFKLFGHDADRLIIVIHIELLPSLFKASAANTGVTTYSEGMRLVCLSRDGNPLKAGDIVAGEEITFNRLTGEVEKP